MKSLNFTHFTRKILAGEKDQTFRCLFFPSFIEKEKILLTSTEFGPKIDLMIVPVTEIYPRKIRDILLEEARRDGFNSIKEMQTGLLEINHLKSIDRWGMIIRWEPGSGLVSLEDLDKLIAKLTKNSHQRRLVDYVLKLG